MFRIVSRFFLLPLVLNPDRFRVVAISLRAAINRILAIPDLAGLARVKPKAKAEPNPKKRTRDVDEDEGDHDDLSSFAGTCGDADVDGFESQLDSSRVLLKRPLKKQVRSLASLFF
jgi:hypothetical protein